MHNSLKINASNTFVMRSVCKKCAMPPSIYFFSRNPVLWYNPNEIKIVFEFIKKYTKRMCPDNFPLADFLFASRIGFYNHSVNYKGYDPKLHMSIGSNQVSYDEYLVCECGKTIWKFNDKSSKHRIDIASKKARYDYSKRFRRE